MPIRPAAIALTVITLTFALTTPATPATPAAADQSADQLQTKVRKAYDALKSYEADIKFTRRQLRGRWDATQSTTFRIALDRPTKRLLIDGPDWQLADDGTLLQARSRQVDQQLKRRHIESPSVGLAYEKIAQAIPFVREPILPDAVMLLSNDPFATLTSGIAVKPQYIAPTPGSTPEGTSGGTSGGGLIFDTQATTITLRIDPVSSLIQHVTVNYKLPAGTTNTEAVTDTYQFKTKLNQPIDNAQLTFDKADSNAVANFQALIQPGQPQQQAKPQDPLVGKPAPPVELPLAANGKIYKLADDKSAVVVLDFWATWCGPCRMALPKLQAVYDWAKKEKLSVNIFAVNQGETVEQVKTFWAAQKLTIPVLMDAKQTVGSAFGVQGIPTTVIIHKGKVIDVHVGFNPNMDAQLKQQITKIINTPPVQ